MYTKLTRLTLLTIAAAILAATFNTPKAASRPRNAGVGIVVNYMQEYHGVRHVRPALIMRVLPDRSCDLLVFDLYRESSVEAASPNPPLDVHPVVVEAVPHDEYRSDLTWHFVDK